MERLSHVYDCSNNLIFFDHYVCDDKKNFFALSIEQFAKTIKTVSAPAIIIESNNDKQIRYYFRAISWEKTLLIGVSFCDGVWKVKEYFENPSGCFVLMLLKKNMVTGGIKLIQQNEVANKKVG